MLRYNLLDPPEARTKLHLGLADKAAADLILPVFVSS